MGKRNPIGICGALAAAIVVAAVAASGPAAAQTCNDYVAEGSGATREAAMRQAYVSILRSAGGLAEIWENRNMRIGEAPGASVQKLGSRCNSGGAGQVCRVEATICRN